MKKFSAKKIGIAGATVAIGVAAIVSSQSFANASPTTAPTNVAPSISGTTSSIPEATDTQESGPDVQQTGNYDDGTPDVAGASEVESNN